ncbi:MAG: hypothetical protein SAJ12_10520 [Jaaginema sp. PMC 1079.18]|nr:hypothetical protein [Jaaginema sp. PMC 1080.18]MEC4851435.1 hypothetical protein [Jaaginema sp. PMC 1079.18]MEC4866095.1 hypothetical protein [Jaaginema sp. PMC 1078.18]
MATAITTTAGTLEGQLLEILFKMQQMENTSANNPNGKNAITGTINSDSNTFAGSFTLALTTSLSASGQPTFDAEAYLVD